MVFETDQIQWSFDLQNDPRFTPHPQATRVYHSLISVPILQGDTLVGVLNVDSTQKFAFSLADFTYVTLLGVIISVVASFGGVGRRSLDRAKAEGQVGGGNVEDDRGVY